MTFPSQVDAPVTSEDSAPRAATVGRLAPTPSGRLHLGNVVAFAGAWLSARAAGGTLLLRMEDVDTTRARLDVEQDQRADLEWLGLTWDAETPRQSERDYAPALAKLGERVYGCTCTRAQIRAASPSGAYPGTCRDLGQTQGALRLRVEPGPETFRDRRFGDRTVRPDDLGDPVLRRKDGLYTYTLAVVADDLRDGVTEVVRGADLLDYSALQARLWRALGGTPPTWMHTPLVLGHDGRKLSKSHGARHVRAMRARGWEPQHIWAAVLPWLGIDPGCDRLEDAIDAFDPAAGPLGPIHLLEDPDAGGPRRGLRWSLTAPTGA